MNRISLKTIAGLSLGLILVLSAMQISATAQEAQNELRQKNSGTSSANARKIEGVWEAQVSINNCQTGNAITTFKAMSIFISGGSLLDTNSAPTNTRGPGFGRWQYIGNKQYTAIFRFFMYNPDGSFAGMRRVKRNITLSTDSNNFTGMVTTETFDAAGNVIASGCSTETAKRVE